MFIVNGWHVNMARTRIYRERIKPSITPHVLILFFTKNKLLYGGAILHERSLAIVGSRNVTS